MAATVTAMRTATAAVATPVPQTTPTPAAQAAPTGTGEVSIIEPPFRPQQTWTYDPQQLSVKVGTKVTWTNSGAVAHTVTADQGSAFDSETVDPKATWSFTFSSPGTFAYHCTFHPWMKATVSVSP